ncbi:hypothetical protein MRX96_038512 [Rhipicephalus microplus]
MRLLPNSRSRRTTLPEETTEAYPPKSPEEHVLSFLWYAANKCCIRDVAGRFEITWGNFPTTLSRFQEVKRERLKSKMGLKRRQPQNLS